MTRNKQLVAFLAACALATTGCGTQQTTAAAQQQAPPPTNVSVVQVVQKDVPIYGDWVATLDGYVNAVIQPQVSGYLIKQDYREGSFVHKGDVLFEIDPRPFQAVVDQAKGQLAQAKGQLAQSQAQLGLAEINVKRDTPLAAARAIAQSQLDNDVQTQKQYEASIVTGKANIEAAQAALETAEINLGFTKVRSLIDGIAGIATTQMGNLVSQTTTLTTVSQVNPIKVYFPISEQEYMLLSKKVKSADLLRNNHTPLELTLANGQKYPYSGHIVFADRQVDTQTGTIRIVGAFDNPGNLLRPGQFGRIRAMTGMRHNALLIPQRAVTELQGRYQVAIVEAGNKVKIENVSVGERVGENWLIASGLRAGETVITEGVSKVRDGVIVNPKPETASPEPNQTTGQGQ
jgi:membrane fusion protein (multidrug efflux system)